jgi:hypothetical protein
MGSNGSILSYLSENSVLSSCSKGSMRSTGSALS